MIDFSRGVTRSLRASFAALAGGMLALALPQAQAQDLYWTTNGPTIMGADLDGSNVVEVFDGTGMAGTAVDVAVTATHLYWTDKNDTSDGGVWRANRDGSEAALFVSNPDPSTITTWAPQFIVIDEDNDRLYFTDYYTGLYSARLSDGGDVIALGGTGGQFAGLTQLSATELIYGNGTSSDTSFYLTDLATESSSFWRAGAGDGQHYGLAYDVASGLLYYTSFGDGAIRSLNPDTWASADLVTGLSGALGLTLSASGSHLLYVERNSDRISAYDIANPENSFELLSGAGAFFGVAIWGDPLEPRPVEPPDPIAPGTELVHDDFSTGTLGADLTGTFETGKDTSDGKGRWVNGAGRAAVYGGTEENKGFLSTGSGLSYAFLTTDVDAAESFSVVLNNVSMTSDLVHPGASFLFGARRSGVQLGWAYDFRPVEAGDGSGAKIWEVSYIQEQDDPQKVIVGHIDSPTDLQLNSLELRVHGNRIQLYINGELFDHATRPTQGVQVDGTLDYVLHISLNGVPEDTLTLEFDEVTATVIENLEEPAKRRLFVYEGFDYATGDLAGNDGGFGWSQPWVESREANLTTLPIAQVASPGQSYGELSVEGNKAVASEGGRAFRYIDTTGISPEQLDENGNIGKPDTSVWLSFIAQGAAEAADPFWGIALFQDHDEKLFFGKATNGTGLRLSAQTGAQQFDDKISLTEKHFIVIRIDFDPANGDTATLFLNPDPMAVPSLDDQALGVYTGAGFEMSFNRVRLANGGGPGGSIDEFRVGATWNDVTPVPYTVPYQGFVNGDLEAEPFLKGWSYVQHITPHPGIAPGSSTAAYIKTDTSGPTAWPLMSQHRPNWLEYDTIPMHDPVTGEPLANSVMPTGPEWQVGFYTAVADAGTSGNRSLNLGIGNERPPESEEYTGGNAPAINFRISGTGEGWVYHGGPGIPGRGWQLAFPAGTFSPSVETDGVFSNPTVYYIQFDGDYTTSSPFYIISVEEVGGDFSAVSDPMTAFQYITPAAGTGIITVRFNGAVQAPYVVDDIHMITTGDPVAEGFAAWQGEQFGSETDPAIAGPDADPDGDGLKNLVEYALGSDPLAAGTDVLPVTGTLEVSGEEYLTLSFNRPVGLNDVNYDVTASSELTAWGEVAVLVSATPDGAGSEQVIYRHPQPLSAGSRGFLRLELSLQ